MNGHAVGNLVLAALADVTNDFAEAVDIAARILDICGVVLPATSEIVTLVAEFMDGSSYYPSRVEMARGLAAFVRRARLAARYGCRWEATRKTSDGFTLVTSNGDYTCRALVVAVGMAEPWKPDVPGLELVPHYVRTRAPRTYADQRVVILGKRNSGFEVADALLPWARQIILLSPRPALLSIQSRSTAGVRARYLLPYEDHVLGGGVVALDAATNRVERTGAGYRVFAAGTTRPGEFVFDADAVIAATGFTTPLGDLRGALALRQRPHYRPGARRRR